VSQDLEGTAGTPEPTEERTGTPEAGTTGTLPVEEERPERPEETKHRFTVAGRDVELTDEELRARVEESLALKVGAEEKNRRIRELESDLAEARFSVGSQGRGLSAEEQTIAASLPEHFSSLDLEDPKDRMIAETYLEVQREKIRSQKREWRLLVREQDAELRANSDYSQAECIGLIEEARKQGKRLDLKDAYYILRGRKAGELANEAKGKAREDQERERMRNSRELPAASLSSGAPAPREHRIPREKIPEYTLTEYEELKRKGYVLNREDGSLVKRT